MVKTLITAISPDDFSKLIRKTHKKIFKVAFLLGFGSGMRLSEIVGGYRKDNSIIEALTENRVYIKEKKIKVEGGKGKVDRIVPLPKGFKEYMLNLLPLNKTYKNIPSARRSMQRAFKTAARKAGILKKAPKLHFHSLRHGFGTQSANQGMPIHHIKTLMGHSNISTTNVYLESNPKKALESYEKLF